VGQAYEKYGAKGLNDVCIAAISLFLGSCKDLDTLAAPFLFDVLVTKAEMPNLS